MKRLSAGLIVSLLALTSLAQNGKPINTLFWKVSGNGLERPSYLFGTIHMLCKEDAFLGAKLVEAIGNADKIYMELDMDNLFEMLGVMTKMKMRNDTTLADLLTPDEYEKIKDSQRIIPCFPFPRWKPISR
jgi:uncharacterized protein YbaP (TraB family)